MKHISFPIFKVCGLRNGANIRAVENAGADWLGMIFYEKSPRYVEQQPDYLPLAPKWRVGVFVNASYDMVIEKSKLFSLSAVQLHGSCPTSLCEQLKAEGIHVIKAIAVTDGFEAEATSYASVCDLFLFDTPTIAFGGSGKSYNWDLLKAYKGPLPFLLSGGLSVSSIPDLLTFHHPYLIGYDLNSGFEISAGMKDARLIAQFIDCIKSKYSHLSYPITGIRC